jgi:hypothetical protein
MKYIVITAFGEDGSSRKFPIIFPEFLVHSEVAKYMERIVYRSAESIHHIETVSAGFYEVHNGAVHGFSESLGITSDPADKELIELWNYTKGVDDGGFVAMAVKKAEDEKKKESAKIMAYLFKLLKEMDKAVVEFGEYTFGDKGPYEVMPINDICEEIQTDFDSQEAGDILTALARTPHENDFTKQLAQCIAENMEGWDPLFEHPNVDEFFE